MLLMLVLTWSRAKPISRKRPSVSCILVLFSMMILVEQSSFLDNVPGTFTYFAPDIVGTVLLSDIDDTPTSLFHAILLVQSANSMGSRHRRQASYRHPRDQGRDL